jgi:type IV secretory pathway TraG/TraD family ATPase VirD4
MNCGKSSQTFWATSLIFKKLPKESSRPMGENSSNLVTLVSLLLYAQKGERKTQRK